MNCVNELDTDGWFFKVGDVYSIPSQSTHFKITKITIEDNETPDDAKIYGYRVSHNNYNKRVIDPDFHVENEWHRAWYFNEQWDLETP
jgi:hypothetical protein